MQTAIFAGGCFWCTEAAFARMQGVVSVEPGYIGGTLEHPDYRAVCRGDSGHAEAVRVRYDEAVIDYPTLLSVFFACHDPTTLNRQGHDVGPQYRSAVFTLDDAQAEAAREAIARLDKTGVFGAPIVTEVTAAGPFWPAEAEHHHYFEHHGDAPYCQAVIAPKLAKLARHFPDGRPADICTK
ncbi:peptide-methionine (S)-S-oxide reductase MsrA [Crenobacter caeni]|uniref:Peptide methionine sulfoxide reductase MsrA n=1 Tax=Crenobacter caeni TaxID=2705474 RepID=A0A6B2KQA1_9NEIS|nr:peptide-methionine (S)-S-oxide reductase MsrA [Crenobacter caeni]NDV12314.1 peptide-methionine (S)-S-oxide reductase MsrA [Crenobacter caeni]